MATELPAYPELHCRNCTRPHPGYLHCAWWSVQISWLLELFAHESLALGSGGGRASSTHLASIVNSSLYAIYTFSGWGTGVLLNLIGPRWTLTVRACNSSRMQGLTVFKDGRDWLPNLVGLLVFPGGYQYSSFHQQRCRVLVL